MDASVTGFEMPGLPQQESSADLREQLFNAGAVGPLNQIQLPLARITAILGVLLDLDPPLLRQGTLIPNVPINPTQLYDDLVKHWLDRHPTLAKAEVRDSGRGLHVILRLDQPIQLRSDAERDQWAAIVEIVQSALPSDPRAPGLAATTRQLQSRNSKNGRTVSLLRPAEGITDEELLQLAGDMTKQPFKTVLEILTGGSEYSPCFKCCSVGSRVQAGDYVGFCYQNCKCVGFEDLIAEVLE